MASITIRNVPEDLHGRLKRSAERNRRSLNNEILALLEDAIRKPAPDAAALHERIRLARAKSPALTLSPEELKASMRKGLP
jgi:antitoxin FitA